MGIWTQVIHKYCAIFYKGFEHPRILVSSWDPSPRLLRDHCTLIFVTTSARIFTSEVRKRNGIRIRNATQIRNAIQMGQISFKGGDVRIGGRKRKPEEN